jgi:lysophospholipase L1-like esterase
MKKIYDYIIYSLLALIVIVSVILFLPKKDSISEYTLEVKTKNIEINQSDNSKIEATSNGEILYRSYNPLVAIVTKEGNVIGISKGDTKIEVSTLDGKVKEHITVKVRPRNGEQDINPSSITIVGDSRMVGLCSYKWYKNDKGTCIAKVGEGFKWFTSTALSEVSNLSNSKKKYLVINLGVNDLGNVDSYIKKYKELAGTTFKDINIFLLSVNPTKGKYDNLNSKIDTFNDGLSKLAKEKDNIVYCDTVNYLRNNGFNSSDGLHYNEETSKIIYGQVKKCIYDYFNE